MEEHTFQQMQDEMSRFEAEISGADMFMPGLPQMRPVIGAGTFGAVQQQLDRVTLPPPPPPPSMMPSYEQALASGMLFQNVPPPPPPPSMMVPPQVQRQRHVNPMSSMTHMSPMMEQEQFNPFMGRPVLPGPQIPPPKPQPVILSAAPKLYKKPTKTDNRSGSPEHKKKKREHASPALPQQTKPEPPPPPAPAAPAPAPAPSAPAPPPPPAINDNPAPKAKKDKKNRKVVRTAGGQVWEDVTLLDWPDDDFRMFCGDLGNDVTDELLIRTFSKYSSFQRAKVIRDKRTNKSKGFGFVSFKEPVDFIKAMKDMDGRYVGSRPIKLRKSTWRSRALDVVRKKEKEKAALLSLLMAGKS